MIYGIGTDITHLNRIEAAVNRHPKRFAEKLLSTIELQQFATAKNPNNFLAKRWAAKEAFAKACGTGIRTPVLFPNISITNDALGKPQIQTHGELTSWLEKRQITHAHVSLSDDIGITMAFVILETSA